MNCIHLRALVAALGVLLAVPTAAMAAAPATSLVEGVLTSSGGSAAADGDYDITFSIYDAQSSGTQLWTEGPVKVKVAGGRFSHALGSSTAIDAGKLAAAKGQWLTLKVGSDPELPAQPLHSTVFAMHALSADKLSCDGCVAGDQIANGSLAAAKMGFNFAGSSTKGGPALDVACTACVGVSELKFDGDVDLGGNSLKAANGTFSGDVSAKTVTATSFVGDGSKLTGLKTPAGECKNAGEVVKGINADGSLKCVAALDPTALPKDGLNEISNDLLSNQFTDTIAGQSDVAIPDNTGADANATLDFPDIGISQDFELTVEVINTDFSTVSLTVLPPDDKKTGWTLCDPCGDKDSKSYKKVFNSQNLPKSGDLKAWIGANPKGLWNLKALDTSYCIPQAPGNAAICDTKVDGKIVKWSIALKTLSNQKVNLNGDLYVAGKLWGKDNGHGKAGGPVVLGGGVKLGDETATCDASLAGTMRYKDATVQLCTPDGWIAISYTNAFAGSKVITAAQGQMINNWIGNPNMKWKMCHRWSTSKSASAFHTNCNYKGPTVTVAKLSTGAMVGGYASCAWNTNYNSYQYHCPGSFLFNLDNGHRYNNKWNTSGTSNGYDFRATYNRSNYGPCFGAGHDWCFNSSNMSSGYSNLGYNYECRKITGSSNGYSGYSTTDCRNDFSGNYSWTTVEMEVWYQDSYK
ncbi:MAG: TLD domain-containing protein [Deltaproteobacteria bacterium]|nr:TLD domain-containing protein [Deltaproteobacteria bacterium]